MGPWNLIHLISSDRWTGAAEPVTNLVRGLRSRGHRVRIGIIHGRSFEQHVRALGIDLVEGLHLSRSFRPLRDLADMRTLARLIRSEKIDLIHCHLNHDHWLAALTRRLWRLPVRLVRTQHRPAASRLPGLGRRVLGGRLTDATIILSERFRDRDPLTASPPAGRVHVIPGAVDAERYRPCNSGAEVREALGIPSGAPVVGMVAHFKAGRGWRTAIPALARVHRRRPDAHFILAGGHSSLVKWVRAQLDAAGCLDQTHIISDARFEWPQVLAALDLNVWLAPGSEGSARAVLEAMATGRPVIAGDLGIIPDLIESGVNGVTVPRGVTADQLAEAVRALIDDPARRRAMGAAARRTVEERFTLSRHLDQIEALYQSLIA
jgi:glycosyltransferase involved in cell wall biosynthesis